VPFPTHILTCAYFSIITCAQYDEDGNPIEDPDDAEGGGASSSAASSSSKSSSGVGGMGSAADRRRAAAAAAGGKGGGGGKGTGKGKGGSGGGGGYDVIEEKNANVSVYCDTSVCMRVFTYSARMRACSMLASWVKTAFGTFHSSSSQGNSKEVFLLMSVCFVATHGAPRTPVFVVWLCSCWRCVFGLLVCLLPLFSHMRGTHVPMVKNTPLPGGEIEH